MQGRLCVPRAGGQGLLSEHIYVYICSFIGVDFGLHTLYQKQCLVCWSPSNTMQMWGSGSLYPEKLS